MMEYLYLLIILSILIATVAVIGGMGGGVLLTPILLIFFPFEPQEVVSSVLLSLIIPAGIGAFGAFRRGEVNVKLALIFEIPTALGVIVGANTSASVNEDTIKLLFGVLALILSYKMYKEGTLKNVKKDGFWKSLSGIKPVIEIKYKEINTQVSLPVLLIAGFTIGFLSGILGVGGGWLKIPILIITFGLPPILATGTSLFMIVITSLIGGYTHYTLGHINIELTITLIIGLGIGALIGNSLKPHLDAKKITNLISVFLFIIGIIMLSQLLI